MGPGVIHLCPNHWIHHEGPWFLHQSLLLALWFLFSLGLFSSISLVLLGKVQLICTLIPFSLGHTFFLTQPCVILKRLVHFAWLILVLKKHFCSNMSTVSATQWVVCLAGTLSNLGWNCCGRTLLEHSSSKDSSAIRCSFLNLTSPGLHRWVGSFIWMSGCIACCIMKVNWFGCSVFPRVAIWPDAIDMLSWTCWIELNNFMTSACWVAFRDIVSRLATILIQTSWPWGILSVDFLTSITGGLLSLGHSVKALHSLSSTKSSMSDVLAFWKYIWSRLIKS